MSTSGESTSIDAGLPYEQARDELRDIVTRLERGDLSLEESLQLWERGEDLARHCESKLVGAKQRLDAALRKDETDDRPAG